MKRLLNFLMAILLSTSGLMATTYYVDANFNTSNGTGCAQGSCPTFPYTDLHTALSAASSGDEVWVAAGTYLTSTTGDRSASFFIPSGVKVYGGYNTAFTVRDIVNNVSVLSGDVGSSSSNYAYKVVKMNSCNSSTLLDGFTIQDASGNMALFSGIIVGNGIRVNGGSPSIKNCRIKNIVTLFESHGIQITNNSSAVIENCEVNPGNSVSLYVKSSTPTIRNSSFFSSSGATAWCISTPSITAYNNIFWCNGGNAFGGGFNYTGSNNISRGGQKGMTNYNPQFNNTALDLSLSSCSPAIDAGSNSNATSEPKDLLNNNRTLNSTVDMGAYEFNGTANTPLLLTATKVNDDCMASGSGSIDLTVTSGTSPYSYLWSNNATTQDISGLSQGNYSVTVTDANGCQANLSRNIGQNSFSISATGTDVSCHGMGDGSITVNITNGNGPITYTLNGTTVSYPINNLSGGTYNLVVTDNLGCSDNATINISEPFPLSPAGMITATGCNNNVPTGNYRVDEGWISFNYGYSVTWSPTPVSSGSTFPGQEWATYSSTGSKTFTVTENSCTGQDVVTINPPTGQITATSSITHNGCYGGTVGSIDITPTGGNGNYSYQWTKPPSTTVIATTQDLTGVGAGTYQLRISDNVSYGCYKQYSYTINEPASALSASISGSTNVLCHGGSTGSATASAAGGTTPYSYTWSGSSVTTASISGLSAGNHTVTITDANGCTSQATVTITQPASALSASISGSTNVLCHGGSTGSATASAAGGTTPYSYTWSGSSVTTASISGLSAGNHTVTITDANGCTSQATVTITQPASALSASISGSTNVLCHGGSTGSATASAAGGTTPYSYTWSGSSVTTASISGLSAGNHTVTITDANGCTSQATVTITQPASALSASISGSTNVLCHGGSTGSATASAAGGTTPYSYTWSGSSVTTASISGLSAGNHTVTITDANGCTSQATVTITQPASALSASISGSTNVLCHGGSTGSATASAAGGTTPYSYTWSGSSVTTASISGLSAGNHTVTITDANGCTSQATVTITQPASALSASISGSTNVLCHGGSTGSATASAAGGTTPYSYTWSGSSVTTASISGLSAGNHTVTITDANGCTSQATVTITQPASALSASISGSTNVLCHGGSTGSATASAAGGTTPYSYTWSGSSVTTASISGLSAGNHTVTITDANGCTSQATVTITQPASALSASISGSTNVLCHGGSTGSATASAAGGTTPYSYTWSGSSVTTASISGLSAGNHTVTITDANGCTSQATVTITQPASALSASISGSTNVLCHGGSTGSATASAAGGTTPYSYTWSGSSVTTASISGLSAGNHTVTITDANGCTSQATVTITQPASALSASISGSTNVLCHGGSTGSATASAAGGTTPYSYTWSGSSVTTASISGLSAGNHTVTITDANGCTSQATVTITQPASALSASISGSTNVLCHGGSTGSATASAAGGTTPYSYTWSGSSVTTASISGLSAGNHTVTITDANGCTSQATVTITQPASALSASISGSTNVLCHGGSTGSATASAAGGTTPYSYTWSGSSVTTASISGLSAGNHTVTITDANGCTSQATVTITQPASALSASISGSTNVLCHGGSTGSATASAAGGTTPYSYTWSGSSVTTASISGLSAGNHTVTITDANGCTSQATVTITQPASALSASISGSTNVLCHGGSTGSATASAAGGTTPYSYTWSGSSVTTASISGLSAGNHTVTITDANGCTSQATVTITQPASALSASISGSTNVLCHGGSTGSATASAAGGTTPYSYTWSGSSVTTASISGLSAGNHTVTITDANGCTSQATVTITQPASALSASISGSTNVLCHGGSTGSATASAAGGTTPYSYTWSGSSVTTASISGLSAGNHTVTITDANGCTSQATVTITQPASALSASISGSTNVLCHGGSTGSATASAAGGTTPYSYTWSGSSVTTASISGLSAGNHTVTITDANGCTSQATVTITQPASALSASISGSTNVLCHGGSTGSATASAAGGTTPYSYTWSGSTSTTSTGTGLAAGNQSVTVTDNNGCMAQASVTITQPTPISANATKVDISCFGSNDGEVHAAASGGANSGFTYNWGSHGTGSSLTGLGPNNYSVTVTDGNGCTNVNDITNQVTVSEPTAISLNVSYTDNTNCTGLPNGTITASASGGTVSGNYTWFIQHTSNPIITNPTIPNQTQLVGGQYQIDVYDDNSCSASQTVYLTDPPSPVMGVIYVDINATGSNNGQNWCDAYTDLVTAINNASSGNEIWVAAGGTSHYDASSATSKSFELKDGVAIYGGFNTTESSLADRDWKNNETVLTGKYNSTDYSLHVLLSINNAPSAIVDGFTIIKGKALGNHNHGVGGGMLVDNGSPTVTHCVFKDNEAAYGAGIGFVNAGSTQPCFINNNKFESNNASKQGGAMYFERSSQVMMYNIIFYDNEALDGGGAIYVSDNSRLEIANCNFNLNNGVSAFGHSIFADQGGHAFVSNSILWDNPNRIINEINGGWVSVENSDVQVMSGIYPGPNNMNVTPTFTGGSDLVTTSNADFVDAGNDIPYRSHYYQFDYAEEDRFLDGGDPNNHPEIDVGAYEFRCNGCRLAGNEEIESTDEMEPVYSINMYPNPVRDLLTIEWAGNQPEYGTYVVHSMTGGIILQQQFSQAFSFKIDVSDLNDGVYLLNIMDSNGEVISTERFIRKR